MRPVSKKLGLMKPVIMISKFYVDYICPVIRLIKSKDKQLLFNLTLLSII